jgi:hypothetical protein
VSTDAVIGRRSSNRCSHAMQRYSYAAIGSKDTPGTLKPNPQDGLADFVVLREPSSLEGQR